MTPPLTHKETAKLHLASLRAVCENVTALRDLTRVLVVTPDQRAGDLANMIAGGVTESWAQGGGNLGKRLCRAADRALEAGTEAVLMLGADSPTLPVRCLADAAGALKNHDAVLGPTRDGGYYLLGLRRPIAMLFDRINWGTRRVAEQTRQRALEGNIDLVEVQSWYDLDRFDDLRFAQRDLAATDEPLGPAAADLQSLINSLMERHPNG